MTENNAIEFAWIFVKKNKELLYFKYLCMKYLNRCLTVFPRTGG